MTTAEEMKQEFLELYDMMSVSHDVKDMQTFGNVHKEMMEWMIQNKPDLAQEWISKLESIKWHLRVSNGATTSRRRKPRRSWRA